jgi:hypothetical protein
VLELGLTFADPVAPNVPTPAIVTAVALLAFQLKVVLEPLLILVGSAVSASVGLLDGLEEDCDF